MVKLYFTEDHEWISLDGDLATVGITNHAQEQLGDLVFVELPEVGSTVKKGDSVAVVESVKAASDVFSPVDGTISEVNEALSDGPALVNQKAEKEGWLWKMKISDASQLDSLMDAAGYVAMIG
ncbi:glycine cleavage system protein GcvH [Bartonella sp. W8098]|uniref:glycine cleavage system protein GcvH n=1 Tax=Bartonella TaxID=773 RepID=UPI0018DB4D91|nr:MULTISPECIES: glycine cleavage system protein GcvH [Bartonella]MBH9988645.1 glycine cleavage system protein GcvH [Bartonella apis]MBI0172735.1 glycine cleavage system protein GcvH [Bartonella sp. W8151]